MFHPGTLLSVIRNSPLRVMLSLISHEPSVNHCQRSASSAMLSKAVYWKRQNPPPVLPATPAVVMAPPSFSQLGSTMPVASRPTKPPMGKAFQRSKGTTTEGRPTLDQPPPGLSA